MKNHFTKILSIILVTVFFVSSCDVVKGAQGEQGATGDKGDAGDEAGK